VSDDNKNVIDNAIPKKFFMCGVYSDEKYNSKSNLLQKETKR